MIGLIRKKIIYIILYLHAHYFRVVSLDQHCLNFFLGEEKSNGTWNAACAVKQIIRPVSKAVKKYIHKKQTWDESAITNKKFPSRSVFWTLIIIEGRQKNHCSSCNVKN